MDSDFKKALDLLQSCTAAIYSHDDMSDSDILYCDLLKYVCNRYLEVYSNEICVMYRTKSILNNETGNNNNG